VQTGKYNHITDQQLLESYYKNHDSKWLGILLERYTLLLLGVCMKYMKNEEEAKDCVQQIFLKAIAELQKYKVEYFKSWIYMVAKNHCLMKLRDKPARTTSGLDEKQMPVVPGEIESLDLLNNDNLLQLMETSLNELNQEQQQCITLFYLQKKSYQEISEQTGFTMMQVKSYIQNGKRNLKILIEKKLQKQNTH
jgi:RNA polymerase sigma-70 factor (ECF subfamily)